MDKKLSKKEIQRKAEIVETIYKEYIIKLNDLKRKQTEVINQFIKELEQRKVEEIRQSLKGS